MFDSKHLAVCSSRVIPASAADIFEILVTPSRHSDFDGSGSVKKVVFGPSRLYLAAKFGMSMRIVVPYRITNTVVEFEEGRLVAWRHFGGHIWRYRLHQLDSGDCNPRTEVTECFDYSTARSVKLIQLIDAPIKNLISIEKSLERLEKLFTTQ